MKLGFQPDDQSEVSVAAVCEVLQAARDQCVSKTQAHSFEKKTSDAEWDHWDRPPQQVSTPVLLRSAAKNRGRSSSPILT